MVLSFPLFNTRSSRSAEIAGAPVALADEAATFGAASRNQSIQKEYAVTGGSIREFANLHIMAHAGKNSVARGQAADRPGASGSWIDAATATSRSRPSVVGLAVAVPADEPETRARHAGNPFRE